MVVALDEFHHLVHDTVVAAEIPLEDALAKICEALGRLVVAGEGDSEYASELRAAAVQVRIAMGLLADLDDIPLQPSDTVSAGQQVDGRMGTD